MPRALQAASALRLDALLVADTALANALTPDLAALRDALSGDLIVLAQQPDEIDEIMALELGAYGVHRRALPPAPHACPTRCRGARAAGADPKQPGQRTAGQAE